MGLRIRVFWTCIQVLDFLGQKGTRRVNLYRKWVGGGETRERERERERLHINPVSQGFTFA